jgi:hypothetical protein
LVGALTGLSLPLPRLNLKGELTMDVDKLAADFAALKARVLPMLEDYESARGSRPAVNAPGDAKAAAQEHIDGGRFDDAGQLLGLDRAHDGDEDDESFLRRLLAHIHGAKRADAEAPRPADAEADDADHDDGGAQDQGDQPKASQPPADPGQDKTG